MGHRIWHVAWVQVCMSQTTGQGLALKKIAHLALRNILGCCHSTLMSVCHLNSQIRFGKWLIKTPVVPMKFLD